MEFEVPKTCNCKNILIVDDTQFNIEALKILINKMLNIDDDIIFS